MAYTKQNFKDGEVLTAAQLVAMEDGIISKAEKEHKHSLSDITDAVSSNYDLYDFLGTNGTMGLEYTDDCTTFVGIGESTEKDIEIADVVRGVKVTKIQDNALENNSDITSVLIGDNVETIGNRAFYYCDALTSIILPSSLTYIGDNAFAFCYDADFTDLPDSVTYIGNHAFFNCTSLTSVVIPDGVTNIGDYVFNRCSSLTSIVLPDRVTSIGNYAFNGCSKLTNATIGQGVTMISSGAFTNCSQLTKLYFNRISSPNRKITIAKDAFKNCKITDVYISIHQSMWERQVTIEEGNEAFTDATFHYLWSGGEEA